MWSHPPCFSIFALHFGHGFVLFCNHLSVALSFLPTLNERSYCSQVIPVCHLVLWCTHVFLPQWVHVSISPSTTWLPPPHPCAHQIQFDSVSIYFSLKQFSNWFKSAVYWVPCKFISTRRRWIVLKSKWEVQFCSGQRTLVLEWSVIAVRICSRTHSVQICRWVWLQCRLKRSAKSANGRWSRHTTHSRVLCAGLRKEKYLHIWKQMIKY